MKDSIWIPLAINSNLPIHLETQIVSQIKLLVAAQYYPIGCQIPKIQILSDYLKVSQSIVAKAYRKLMLDGYLVGERGAGTFVADSQKVRDLQRNYTVCETLEILYTHVHLSPSEFLELAQAQIHLADFLHMHDAEKQRIYKMAVTLRNMDTRVASMEELADSIVSHLYHEFCSSDGKKNTALIRFFKTHPFGNLPEELQVIAKKGKAMIYTDSKCLTLLGTIGEECSWCDRRQSQSHQVIPLPDVESVQQIPMIRSLIEAFGIDIAQVVKPSESILIDAGKRPFNVFYVPEACNSSYIPAQDFVTTYGIRSVVGFGGCLSSGNIFAIIIFFKTFIPPEQVSHFKWLAAYIRIAVENVEERGIIFTDSCTPYAVVNAKILKDMRGENLSGVNLSGANLSGANLSGANLYGANLHGAIMPDGSVYRG